MKRYLSVLPALMAMLSITGCNLAAIPPRTTVNPAGTAAAQTIQAATSATPPAGSLQTPALVVTQIVGAPSATLAPSMAAPTLAPAGVPVTLGQVTIVIPPGVATGAQTESVAEQSTPGLPYWELLPAYTRITLQGYALQGKAFQPQIFIYPAQDFARINTAAAEATTSLQAILASGTPADRLPFLPPLNAGQVFTSNFQRLAFQNGSGIRYLTQYDQAPLPVNNNELVYTFQGLTQDGKYYVSAVLPVNAAFLSPQGSPDSPLPPDGIPFSWDNFSAMPAYLEAVRQKLESTDPNAFLPSLGSLDAMMQSLSVSLP